MEKQIENILIKVDEGTMDENEIAKLQAEFMQRRNESTSIIPEKYIKAEVVARQDYKMMKIRKYLETLISKK